MGNSLNTHLLNWRNGMEDFRNFKFKGYRWYCDNSDDDGISVLVLSNYRIARENRIRIYHRDWRVVSVEMSYYFGGRILKDTIDFPEDDAELDGPIDAEFVKETVEAIRIVSCE